MKTLYDYFDEIALNDLRKLSINDEEIVKTIRKYDYDYHRILEWLSKRVSIELKIKENIARIIADRKLDNIVKKFFGLPDSKALDFLFRFMKKLKTENKFIELGFFPNELEKLDSLIESIIKTETAYKIRDRKKLMEELKENVYAFITNIQNKISKINLNLTKRKLLFIIKALKITLDRMDSSIKKLLGEPLIVDSLFSVGVTSYDSGLKLISKFRAKKFSRPNTNIRNEINKLLNSFPLLVRVITGANLYLSSEKLIIACNYRERMCIIFSVSNFL